MTLGLCWWCHMYYFRMQGSQWSHTPAEIRLEDWQLWKLSLWRWWNSVLQHVSLKPTGLRGGGSHCWGAVWGTATPSFKIPSWGFPVGPVVETRCFQCKGLRLDSWLGDEDSICWAAMPKNLKNKQKNPNPQIPSWRKFSFQSYFFLFFF